MLIAKKGEKGLLHYPFNEFTNNGGNTHATVVGNALWVTLFKYWADNGQLVSATAAVREMEKSLDTGKPAGHLRVNDIMTSSF